MAGAGSKILKLSQPVAIANIFGLRQFVNDYLENLRRDF
jgi:hypothetical protein